jgi:hypothetical protein
MSSPAKIVRLAKMRPSVVTGTTSPYPIVPRVTIAHHSASGIVPNRSGCAVRSARCINAAAISAVPSKMTKQPPSARRSEYRASRSERIAGEYRVSLKKRTRRRTSRILKSEAIKTLSQNGRTAARSINPEKLNTKRSRPKKVPRFNRGCSAALHSRAAYSSEKTSVAVHSIALSGRA